MEKVELKETLLCAAQEHGFFTISSQLRITYKDPN